MTILERFRPQTATECELLRECEQVATMNGVDVAEVLADAVKWWKTSGRSIQPRQWRSRATAAERLVARGRTIAEYATMQLDPFVEISGFAKMTAEQMTDEITYLADYQG